MLRGLDLYPLTLRVDSDTNVWADDLSRGHVESVLNAAALLGLQPRRVYISDVWWRLLDEISKM